MGKDGRVWIIVGKDGRVWIIVGKDRRVWIIPVINHLDTLLICL